MDKPGSSLYRVIWGLWSPSAVQPLISSRFTRGPGGREGGWKGGDEVPGRMLCLRDRGRLLLVRWWVTPGSWKDPESWLQEFQAELGREVGAGPEGASLTPRLFSHRSV